MENFGARLPYVLMTAAHNEGRHLERTINCVLNQTVRPLRWVIISDNSSDETDEIIQRYAGDHEFIRFSRLNRAAGRNFACKVIALKSGSHLLAGAHFELIGNLDADIILEPDYFERLVELFAKHQDLGVAGGFVYEDFDGKFRSRKHNNVESVPHAAQLVRRACYEAIGGYAVLEFGGEDWHAQISAAMRGWTARAFPELKIFHLRHTGSGGNVLRHSFRQGLMDYSFGSYPLFEVVKCLRRLTSAYCGGLIRMSGFTWGYLSRRKRPVSDEFIAFLRKEQKQRLLGRVQSSSDPELNAT